MRPLLETVTEKRLKELLGRFDRNILYWKFAPLSTAGIPDRIILWEGGNVMFVELKKKGEKPTNIQLYVHDRLRRLGFRVLVSDDALTAFEEIKNVVNSTKEMGAPPGADTGRRADS